MFALHSRWTTVPRPTRLDVRARVAYQPRWIFPFVESVVGLGDWVNVSVMLRGISRRVEGTALGARHAETVEKEEEQ